MATKTWWSNLKPEHLNLDNQRTIPKSICNNRKALVIKMVDF